MVFHPDYQKGYTKALLDVYQVFTQYERQLSLERVISSPASKTIREIIDAMIDNRDYLMRRGVKSLVLVRLKNGKYRIRPRQED